MAQETISYDLLFDRFKAFVEQCGKQIDAAKYFGVTQMYMSDLLRGNRKIGPAIYLKMGYREVTNYIRNIPGELDCTGMDEEL